MPKHPYETLPSHCFWSRSVARKHPAEVDPVVAGKFQIRRSDPVVTAGSCFAQHIARHLVGNRFNFLVTETAHPLVARHAADYGYGEFSARYGNIYTSRQLIQLLQRAYGRFAPVEDVWEREDGRLIDPFRPRIQPNGFASSAEFYADRQQHFAAIRRAIEGMKVLVFTLGLTEGWVSLADGAAFPLCPGVAGGVFDPTRHAFVNLKVAEVVADLKSAIDLILFYNPAARIILTVSPVPLAATMVDQSVLVSTTYSKSVLRAAAQEIADGSDTIAYFPAYEIITGSYARGRYFADDLRSVTEAGVAHVMRLFMKHYAERTMPVDDLPFQTGQESAVAHEESMKQVVAVMCDEEALDPHAAAT